MSRYRKFTTICCAAVFALGLAACGGGDDGISVADRDAAVAAEQAKTEALQMQLAALRAELGLDPEGEDDPATSIQALEAEITRLKGQIQAAANKAQMEQEEAARKAMAATAAKLYDGIIAPNPVADNGTADAGTRYAQHTSSGIDVLIGTDKVPLSEDKDATVADNHGWEGKKYTAAPKGGGMYEAMIYSNIGAPQEGKPFNEAYTIEDKVLTFTSGTSAPLTDLVASRVGGSNFDHTAGFKEFKLPNPNPKDERVVTIAGTYHGVSGTYSCTPGAATCGVRKASKGFDFGTVSAGAFEGNSGSWTFEPSSPTAKVTDTKDNEYVSYGWWIHKAANDGAFAASAFVIQKNDGDAAASDLNALNGTAIYMGGAAGKYALASSTGGTNDAGHFTAMVTLEADFNVNDGTDTTGVGITGMIDNFMGADGMPRDWSVKLNGSPIGDTGGIGDAGDTDAAAPTTVWTIGEDAAKADGSWTGMLRNNKNNVPQVVTGTFNAEYGTAGNMVGAFGANKQ